MGSTDAIAKPWDIDTWWHRYQEDRRQALVKDLDARCPRCGASVLDELLRVGDTNEWPLPSQITVGCPECETEIEFEVEWSIEMVRARQVQGRGDVHLSAR